MSTSAINWSAAGSMKEVLNEHPIIINRLSLTGELCYQSTTLLTYQIDYPQMKYCSLCADSTIDQPILPNRSD